MTSSLAGFRRWLVCWLALVFAAALPAAIAADAESAQTARVIVKFKSDAALLRQHALSASAGARETAQQVASRATSLGARVGLGLSGGRALDERTQVFMASGLSSQALSERLAQEADVEWVAVDHRRHVALVPNDPLYLPTAPPALGPAVGQWYLQAPTGAVVSSINAPAAWDRTTGSASIVVAVLDTGVRYEHPDLVGQTLAGRDFISNTIVAGDGGGYDADASDPGDYVTTVEVNDNSSSNPLYHCTDPDSTGQYTGVNSDWHGTMTSSLIAAASNDGVGMSGVAWGVKLLPVRVLGKCGGYDSDIVAGMKWAAGLPVSGVPANTHPARVINMSLGGAGTCAGQTGLLYGDAMRQLTTLGVVVVVAAGNGNGEAVGVPANCPGVIAVAGLRHVGTKSGFSNLGPEVTLSAPAGNCVNLSPEPCLYPMLAATNTGTQGPLASTYTDSFNYSVGTSFSTPLVAGTAALMLSIRPDLTPTQVRSILQSTTRAFPTSGVPDDPQSGPVAACHAPNGVEQAQCYCTGTTCGAGMLDAAAAVAAAASAPVSSGSGGGAVSVFVLLALTMAVLVLASLHWRSTLASGSVTADHEG